MKFAILRVQKLKSTRGVHGSLKHAFREQNTPNADPDKLELNTHIGAKNANEAITAFNARLPDKIRKNGVVCIEYLISGSPEAIHGKTREEQDDYFTESLEWIKAKHGAENVVYAGVHRDESTPHMYAYVVPIDPKGKLNCRHFLGGHKDVLADLQTNFVDRVAKNHGLERGLEGSKAKHTTIKEFYSGLSQEEKRAHFKQQDRITKGREIEQTLDAMRVDDAKEIEIKTLKIAPTAFNAQFGQWQKDQEEKRRRELQAKLDKEAQAARERKQLDDQQRPVQEKQQIPQSGRGFTR